jgi:hypothetical protein
VPRDRYYDDEERIYHKGFRDGYRAGHMDATDYGPSDPPSFKHMKSAFDMPQRKSGTQLYRKKRKLSAWNKFVRANSKKKQFRYASGKVNLKKLGVAYRKKKRGR